MNDERKHRAGVLEELSSERDAQIKKFGDQSHLPNGTGLVGYNETMLKIARGAFDLALKRGRLSWDLILAEEFWECMSERNPVALRGELVQVAAVAVAWIESIDVKAGGK